MHYHKAKVRALLRYGLELVKLKWIQHFEQGPLSQISLILAMAYLKSLLNLSIIFSLQHSHN